MKEEDGKRKQIWKRLTSRLTQNFNFSNLKLQ